MLVQNSLKSFNVLMLFALAQIGLSGVRAADSKELVDESFGVVRVTTGCKFTEGPVVDSNNNLFFSDGPNDRIMKLDPK